MQKGLRSSLNDRSTLELKSWVKGDAVHLPAGAQHDRDALRLNHPLVLVTAASVPLVGDSNGKTTTGQKGTTDAKTAIMSPDQWRTHFRTNYSMLRRPLPSGVHITSLRVIPDPFFSGPILSAAQQQRKQQSSSSNTRPLVVLLRLQLVDNNDPKAIEVQLDDMFAEWKITSVQEASLSLMHSKGDIAAPFVIHLSPFDVRTLLLNVTPRQ